jgi:ABC-type protease/lipase transport system fused ATPase/permease subunit
MRVNKSLLVLTVLVEGAYHFVGLFDLLIRQIALRMVPRRSYFPGKASK